MLHGRMENREDAGFSKSLNPASSDSALVLQLPGNKDIWFLSHRDSWGSLFWGPENQANFLYQ
jgi:hypothetical protein